jgi:DNA helicase-2/ATP-dependent DNA helicase PcrA
MAKNSTKARQKYQERFEEILTQLNPSQRAAVDTIEGPVLTIAGPGTGKTHILAARIGQILTQTDTQPHNVLCLTYTDAGVYAMRRRLLEFIGPEAHRVHIFTFHSFCNKVIQENLDVFGYNELQLASDLERIDIVRQIIDELEADHPLKINNRRNPYKYEAKLLDLFSRMKTEGWDAAYISQQIDDYIESLPSREKFIYKRNGPGYKKGDLNYNKYNPEVETMEKLRAGAFLFDEYEYLMQELGRYDYEDMILWVVRAFNKEENEAMLRRYQEQYLYVLVDEFQDTNGAQSKILQKLIDYWEQPNIFIVGDDDQSIYEFQGARVKNMIDFYGRYEKYLTVIVLRENYRSGQNILDAAKQVIDRNEIRIIKELEALNIDKDLVAANKDLDPNELELVVHEYPNRIQEEVDIVYQIKELQEQNVPLSEIAIIYAKHRQSSDLIRLLERHDIPYQTKRQINILETPLIQNLLHLITYIAKEFERPYSGEEYVYELLHFDFLNIVPSDVSRLTAFLAKTNRQKHDNRDYDYLQWRDLLRDEDLLKKAKLKEIDHILAISEFLDEMIHVAVNNPLPDVIERLFNRSGLIAFITQHPEKNWLVEVANTFFDFVRRESMRNSKLNIWGLLELIDRMEANRLELGVAKGKYAEEGVNLITAHGAKGLEFKYVFVLHCLKDFWEPSSRQNPNQFRFPDYLTQTSEETDAMEAARRLFYVAMTRTKSYLHLSYHSRDHNNKEAKRTEFLDDLLIESDEVEVRRKHLPEAQLYAEQLLFLEEKELPASVMLDSSTLDALLEGFRLSVSSLNSYLECPRSFYFQRVLKIPSTSSVEALYGDAVHNALKRIFDQAEASERKRIPPVTELTEAFRQEMIMRRIQFNGKAFQDAIDLGLQQLPRYYAQRIKQFNEQIKGGVWTEKPFRNVEYKGVPLTGIIDKVVFVKDRGSRYIHVVDYKTGRLESSRFTRPHSRNLKGGNYYRQLVFYKILLENSGLVDRKVRSAEIDYLSPNETDLFPFKKMEISKKDVDLVGEMVTETYKAIKEHKFGQGCNKKYCKWCNFVKKKQMPESFRNEETEKLDD